MNAMDIVYRIRLFPRNERDCNSQRLLTDKNLWRRVFHGKMFQPGKHFTGKILDFLILLRRRLYVCRILDPTATRRSNKEGRSRSSECMFHTAVHRCEQTFSWWSRITRRRSTGESRRFTAALSSPGVISGLGRLGICRRKDADGGIDWSSIYTQSARLDSISQRTKMEAKYCKYEDSIKKH